MTPGAATRATLCGWRPPSEHLRLQNGLWVSAARTPVSYPEAGNDVCFQIEDGSYWFRHRMECITTVLQQFPPAGMLYDIGGGNGFVTLGMQRSGLDAVLLEPGPGAVNARNRGVERVIQATLTDAGFRPSSLAAAGAFDVLEHIENDLGFLRTLHSSLAPGARFYCTVPASRLLWSEEDVYAGHYRRYSRRSLTAVLGRAGFEVEFISPFFAWLTGPVIALRALPTGLGLKNRTRVGTTESIRAEHRLPSALAGLVGRAQEWELNRLRARRPLPFGTSLLCVARRTPHDAPPHEPTAR